ncbi:Leucine-rich repeat-containing protein 47 [Blattella germanica]|nr:Leucine-rich repeat-containing protein 47 [Blattella germanica]
MSSNTWSEIEGAITENRHELILSGPAISKKIEEDGLDKTLFTLSNLNYLCISQTCLDVLPDGIGNLTNLTNLVLHSNKISQLPSTLGKLTNLKMLDLSRNKLEIIPDDVSKLPHLSTLNVSSNMLYTFPSMSQNTKLSILDLSGNQFEEFPDICYPDLIHLAEVKLNGNKLKEIPPNVKELSSLKSLDLGDNNITTVPGELADISKLKEINLKGNKLSDKRLLKLVDQCRSKQVLDYVRQHCPRSSTSVEAPAGGKGKKGKKGKKEHADSQAQDNVDQLSHRLQVLYVSDEMPVVTLDEAVKTVRAHIVCCVINNVSFTPESFKKFIQLQTKLHDTVCEKRHAATIATHDLESFMPDGIIYTAYPPNEVKICPLGKSRQMTGQQLFSHLQREAEELRKEKKRNVYSGIHKYLYLLEGKPVYPAVLNGGRVISLPPITNSDNTKISDKTKNIFVEVTSASSQSICRRVLDTLLQETLFLGIGDGEPAGDGTILQSSFHQLSVRQIKIVDKEGNLKIVYPSRTDLVFDNNSISVIRE